MEIRFLGAVGVVTGSCTWLRDEARGWSFLVDCGVQQEAGRLPHWSRQSWPFEPATLQFVALTHAHLDHCGLIPVLYRRGFTGQVFCTEETAEIAKLVLLDAAKNGLAGYDPKDVEQIRWRPFTQDKPFGQPRPVATDLFLRTYRSGHVIGAVSLEVLWGPPGESQRSIVFSGDLGPGCEDAEVSPLIRFPWKPRPANYAVVESTYGDTVRSAVDRDPVLRIQGLRELVDQTMRNRGTLLLPAFAIGRMQDLMFDLHLIVAANPDRYAELRVVLDAALASKVQGVYANALQKSDVTVGAGKVRLLWMGKQIFRLLGLDDSEPEDIDAAMKVVRMTFEVKRGDPVEPASRGNDIARNWRPLVETRRAAGLDRTAQPPGPTVILCGSADGESGAAASWIPTLLSSSDNTIATTGYTPSSSVLSTLATIAGVSHHERRRHTGAIKWSNAVEFKIRAIEASVRRLRGYSAHADQSDLTNWLFYQHAGQEVTVAPLVFVQHGEDRQRSALASAIQKRATAMGKTVEVRIPSPTERDSWFSLEAKQ